MWLMDKVKEAATYRLSRYADEKYRDKVETLANENWRIQESLDRLELEIENEGYMRLTQLVDRPLDRRRLGEIVRLCTQLAIKNPIVNRTVNVQADYVFGRGVRFVAKDPDVQGWVDEFVKYRENRKILTSSTAMRHQERNLEIQGNLFFPLYTNEKTGRVIIRSIEFAEVQDIIRDPDDYQRSLYIRRAYHNGTKEVVIYHPVLWIDENDPSVKKPWEYKGLAVENPEGEILWDAPAYIMQFNLFGKDKFAPPEVYPQIDWALAYKRFLEDWTSIIRSFARMALKVVGLAGKKQMAATKNMMQTTVSIDNPSEKNPSGTASRIPLLGKGVDIEAVKTAGATTPAKEGLPVLNMAAAAAGLPSSFYGDSSMAKSDVLDRPIELKFVARQELWKEAFNEILRYVVHVRACVELGSDEEVDPFTDVTHEMPKVGDRDLSVAAIFPNILERNVTDRVRALCNAVTMFGKQLTDIIPDKKFVSRLLLEALDIPDVDERVESFVAMWETNMKVKDDGKPVDALIIPPAPPQTKGAGAEDPSQGGDVGSNG